mgnify:FL=1
MPQQDLERLKKEYQRRADPAYYKNTYSFSNPAYVFMLQSQERALLSCLKEFGFQSLNQSKILAIGCGRGGVMLGFLRYGATASNLSGIDILLDRVVLAKQTLPESKISCADGQFLPYESAQFDILLQFTAFSSILDPQIKRNMASEMLRVLKPDGVILWYDFWWNPTNPQTAGIKPKEIKILFSNCVFKLHKITLAPPIARLIVPISWALAVILESLKVFNSHYLAIITKQ